MNKDAEILNCLLNKIGVKGFSFIYEDNYLSIRIPRSNDMIEYYYFDYCLVGTWLNLNDFFNNNSLRDTWSIEHIINCVLETRNADNNLSYSADYLNINNTGLDFLRCLTDSGSLDELKLRLQIMGYDI